MHYCDPLNLFIEAKKGGADSSSPDDADINTIDKHQVDEIVIPMPAFFKRRSLFETDVDPDTIQINVLADEKPCGSLSLTPEDLRMLVNSLIGLHISDHRVLGSSKSTQSKLCTVSDH
jgi:hypothetical protein